MEISTGFIQRSFALFLLFCLLLMSAWGCGRTELMANCAIDEDCATGWVCADQVCSPDRNNGENQSDAEDNQQSDVGCSSDFDCGDGVCYSDGAGCVSDVCNVATGQCEPGAEACIPDCAAGFEQVGCQCLPVECEESTQCQGRVCESGTCRACFGDGECSSDGSLICEAGVCVDGPDCVEDDDCRPHEMCSREKTCVDRPQCTFDDDCIESEQCIAGVCTYTPECEDDDQCSAHSECVGGVCQLKLCRGNNECPDNQLCDSGECIDPPLSTSCIIITDGQTIAPNERIPLEAFAFNQFGQGVAASFLWTSSNPDVAEIEGSDLVGKTSVGTTEVTAVLAGGDPIVCSGKPSFENLGLTPAEEIRVRVVHMETGAPVAGAQVYLGDQSAVSNASGIVSLAKPNGAFEISVFHDDYNFLTVQGVNARDLRVPISPRSGSGPVAGFTGIFNMSAAQTTGEIELGLAGGSLAGDLLDINLERLLGDPFVTEFDIPTVGLMDIPLPGGVTAHGQLLAWQLDGKQTYYAQAGAGARLGWGMAGRVPFSDMLGLFMNPPQTMADTIALLLPLFSRFDHGQQPLILEALPRVLDIQDINNNGNTTEWLPNYDAFPQENIRPSVRQQLTTEINISRLPVISGVQTEVAILVGGVQLDGPGFMPLGISATVSEDGSGQPERRTLYMAPQYGAAVGGRYAVMAIAFNADGITAGFGSDFSASLWNGQTLNSATNLGTLPDSSTGSINVGQRTIAIDATAGPIFRVRMVGEERSWDVWSMGSPGVSGEFSHSLSIPVPPAGQADIFGEGGTVYVDAIRTSVTIDDLVRSSGVGLRRAGLVTTSFNRTSFR